MAAGSDLLDEVFFNTEVDEKVVNDLVGSLESELTGSGHGNSEVRVQAVSNHTGNPGVGGNANVQESKMGLAQQLAKAGAGVQGGVINNTRSQGSAMDAATGITSAAGSTTSVGHSQGKTVAVSAMVTAVPNHDVGSGKVGTSGVQTLNGSNVVMNSHNSGSVAAYTGTPVSSTSSGSSSNTVPVVSIVNNGPGSVVKENVNAVLPPSSSTVIQTSLMNAQNIITSTVISSQATSLSSGPTVTLVRPPMQTQGLGTTQNGSNNTVLTSTVNVANLNTTVPSGIPLQTPLLNRSQSPATVAVSGGPPVIKSESPKTIIQTTHQTVAAGVVTNVNLSQPMQSALQPATSGSAAGAIGKSPVLQNVTRTPTSATVPATPGGIRAIAPQVLAPRLPHPPQNQPNIQNIQLPPGMVLVRSDSGQLLMIHQQTLAQMQAQSQSQSAMAPRPATPTSSPPVQLTSVQAPGTPILTRQVTPTTIIKQATPTQTTVQRPPVLQNPIMLGGAAAATSVGTAAPVQPGVAPRTVIGTPGTPTTTATETLENVKKCKNFLSTLIKLASSGKQSSETAANVKELVKNLLEGKLEAEDFTSRLYRELNSSPQPYLVPFLKRSLPALRQLTPDSAAFIQQSQFPQTTTTTALTAVVLSSPMQRPAGKTSATVTSTLHQPVISLAQPGQGKAGQPASLILQQSQQQAAMVRPPQVTLAQTPMVTLRQPHSRLMLSQPQVVICRCLCSSRQSHW
ncbi:hypothetical protein AAFF_G00240370 [Aldrovandia affinis]|uniref:TAFH domain-containing protein n=1 Tax=Aldrovandia affinis TaxID=143900 RepID=A0AAD7WTM0_9TELE|nr:hypothetical protein AAFF_G00240370 [Aldrovandia affinis]